VQPDTTETISFIGIAELIIIIIIIIIILLLALNFRFAIRDCT